MPAGKRGRLSSGHRLESDASSADFDGQSIATSFGSALHPPHSRFSFTVHVRIVLVNGIRDNQPNAIEHAGGRTGGLARPARATFGDAGGALWRKHAETAPINRKLLSSSPAGRFVATFNPHISSRWGTPADARRITPNGIGANLSRARDFHRQL